MLCSTFVGSIYRIAGMKLFKTLVKPPVWLQFLLPNVTWKKSNSNSIYLTFDDGPTPEITDFVLQELEKYNAKATFFCIGKNVLEHPEICAKVAANGHALANHTMNHIKGWKVSTEVYLQEIEYCNQALQKVFPNKKVNFFRPPYGKISPSQIQKVSGEYEIVLWSVLSCDYDESLNSNDVVENVIQYAQPGSIIVFHDSKKAFPRLKAALPKVLAHFSEKGFQFSTL